MLDPIETSPAPPDARTIDEGLRCLNCGYNLTGLTDNRCPECGHAYDAEALRAAMAGKLAPVPGWDDGSGGWASAFVITCLQTWISPSQFGRRFPLRHNRGRGMLFRVISLGAALVIFANLCIVANAFNRLGSDFVVVGLAIPPGVMLGAIACEGMLALVFSWCMRRAGAPMGHRDMSNFVSWRGLVGFFRSYMLISALLITPCFASHEAVKLSLAILAAIAFWWHGLARATIAASAPGAGRIVACLAIPVVATAAILLGFAISFAYGLCLFLMFGSTR